MADYDQNDHDNDFPIYGLKLSFILNEFLIDCGEILEDMTTDTVCQEIIIPSTEHVACSYCDMLHQQGHPAAGKAEVFISHAWSYKFLDVWNALRDHFNTPEKQEIFIWFDVFSVNQHVTSKRNFQWWSDTFQQAIKTFGHTVMIISPWSDPIPFTRAWCLWELYSSVKTEVKLDLVFSRSERIAFLEDISNDTVTIVNRLLSKVNVERSECYKIEDKEAIFEAIRQDIGFQQLNTLIFATYREWVIDVTRQASEDAEHYSEQQRNQYRSNLASLYGHQGQYDLAVSLHEICLQNNISFHGEDHPHTISSMNQLGLMYMRHENFDKAESMLKDCYERSQRIHGKNHERTLATLNNLGLLYFEEEKYEQAEEALLATLTARMEDNHTSTTVNISDVLALVVNCNNLAAIYEKLSKYQEAEKMFLQTIKLGQSIFGPDHPEVINAIGGLALLYHHQGKSKVLLAEQYYHTCYSKRKELLGMDHPETITTFSNMIAFYQENQQPEKAIILLKEKLLFYQQQQQQQQEELNKLKTNNQGNSYSKGIIQIMNEIGKVYYELGKLEEAEQYSSTSVIHMKNYLQRSFMEPNDEMMIITEEEQLSILSNLAAILQMKKKNIAAIDHYQECVRLASRVYGKADERTVMFQKFLAQCYEAQKQWSVASNIYEEVIQTLEQHHTNERRLHPTVLHFIRRLATAYLNQGDVPLAECLLVEYLAAKHDESVQHDVIGAMKLLVAIYEHQGRSPLNEPWYAKYLLYLRSAGR